MKKTAEIKIDSIDVLTKLLGVFDENLKIVSEQTETMIFSESDKLKISGEEQNVKICVNVLDKLIKIIKKGESIDSSVVLYCIELARQNDNVEVENVLSGVITITPKGKQIKYKTLGQKNYVDAIKKNEVVFGVGPAGTGKTYLAVAMAVSSFRKKEVEKIILTRPAVEAGESLGFLPGDLQSKVDPYLRPLYDALQEMFGLESYQKLIEKGVIEIAPLAYMRGRTLNNSFIILDEAQNTTKEQMKMFLTRMGEGSRMVITGDVTQIDLPSGKKSGLVHATEILKNIDGIGIVKLTSSDVVRHSLVMKIIKAYDKFENTEKLKKKKE